MFLSLFSKYSKYDKYKKSCFTYYNRANTLINEDGWLYFAERRKLGILPLWHLNDLKTLLIVLFLFLIYP